MILRRTSSKRVPSRVFAKEYEQTAKLSALGNAVDHAIEWLNCPVSRHRHREIERAGGLKAMADAPVAHHQRLTPNLSQLEALPSSPPSSKRAKSPRCCLL